MPKPDTAWFSGLFLPVTTPFDPETGELAPVSFRENLRRWLSSPVDGIVLFGSTGEGVLLSVNEKLRLASYARDLMPASMPLVAGTGGDATRAVLAGIREMAETGVVDAVLVHPPPYYASTLSSGQIRDHYRAIADASPLPVIVYHIPKYTNVLLEPALVAELARHENIVGLKDSSGDLKRFAEFSEVCADQCRLFVGNGTLFYTALEFGASGGILAVGLLATDACAELLAAFRAGRTQEAGRLQERLTPVHKEVVARYGAAGVKVALDLLGFHGGSPRSPLTPLGEKERAGVAQTLQNAGLLS